MSVKQPVFFKSEQAAIDNMDVVTANRSRPVMAKDKAGFIVCCKTTAKKHGWEVLGKLYFRNKNTAVAETAVKDMAAAQPEFWSKLEVKQAARKAKLAHIDSAKK